MNYIYALVLSGGVGSRLGSNVPKQFLKVKDSSLLSHSVRRFKEWGLCRSIVVVSHPDFVEKTEEDLGSILDVNDKIVLGGETRHQSFLNGLKAISPDKSDIIFVHDAARPFFTQSELFQLVDTTLKWGSASLGVRPTETLVLAQEDKAKEVIERENVYSIKTPQCFHSSVLELLLESSSKREKEPTDLCSWTIPAGMKTRIVESNPYNLKVTKQEDLEIAEVYSDLFDAWNTKLNQ